MIWQLTTILLTSFSAYIYSVFNCKFVIDDTDGILAYDGKVKNKSYYDYIKHFWYVMASKDPKRHHWFSVVLQMRGGLIGMAIDYWTMATKINPNYDVPYYNTIPHQT